MPWKKRTATVIFALLGLALLAPFALSARRVDPRVHAVPHLQWYKECNLDWPRVYAGDEPHYLITISSLLRDFDLDLSNNYARVAEGHLDAGRLAASYPLDHHTAWYVGDKYVHWQHLHVRNELTSTGKWRPVLAPGVSPDSIPPREYSHHSYGLAFILAPLLYPARNSDLLEPLALFCTGLAVVGAMFCFRLLLEPFHLSNWFQVGLIAATFLGTPIWHYGRTLTCEPFLLLFAVGAYALFLRRQQSFLAGTLIGLGILLKPPFVVLLIPLLVSAGMCRQWRSVLGLCLPSAIAVAIVLVLNQALFGAWYHTPQPWKEGHLLTGLQGLLLSSRHGLLPFAPLALVALVMWPRFLQSYPRDGAVLLAGITLYLGSQAMWGMWDGGFCYGPRLILPIIPLLFASLAIIPDSPVLRIQTGRVLIGTVAVVSILTNLLGAFPNWMYVNSHPIVYLLTSMRNTG